MGYDQEKDILIKLFEFEQEKSTLQLSVFSYDGGEAKLQLVRSFKKQDGTIGYSKIGRLNKEEVKFILDRGPEILELIVNFESSKESSWFWL